MGNLLSIFSGCSTSVSADALRGLNSSADITGYFVANISHKLFDPLKGVLSGKKELIGIIALAELLVNRGHVRSVRDVEEYIIHIAKVSVTYCPDTSSGWYIY